MPRLVRMIKKTVGRRSRWTAPLTGKLSSLVFKSYLQYLWGQLGPGWASPHCDPWGGRWTLADRRAAGCTAGTWSQRAAVGQPPRHQQPRAVISFKYIYTIQYIHFLLSFFVSRVKEGPLSVPGYYFILYCTYNFWQDAEIWTRVAARCASNELHTFLNSILQLNNTSKTCRQDCGNWDETKSVYCKKEFQRVARHFCYGPDFIASQKIILKILAF